MANEIEEMVYNHYKNENTDEYLYHVAKIVLFLSDNRISKHAKMVRSKIADKMYDLATMSINDFLLELRLNTVQGVLASIKNETNKRPTTLNQLQSSLEKMLNYLSVLKLTMEKIQYHLQHDI